MPYDSPGFVDSVKPEVLVAWNQEIKGTFESLWLRPEFARSKPYLLRG